MKLRFEEIVIAFFAFAVVLVAFVFAFNGAAARDFAETAAASVPAKAEPSGTRTERETDFSEEKKLPRENPFALDFDFGETTVPAADSPVPAEPAAAADSPVPAADSPAAAGTSAPAPASRPAKAPRPAMKNFSCAGQICIDADTGKVLSSRNADVRHPPASVTKLMTIFLVLDAVDAGTLRLTTPIVASRRAQDTGGTQVYLAEGEVNSTEELLYALMLQSANDAAVALAEKVGGSVEEFVAMMNRKARELGMTRTEFSTPHGLPISKKERAAGKQPDMTSASDLAKLSRALIRTHPEVFRYSAAKRKNFRDARLDAEPLPMENHNRLLDLFPGCDGLKTGWTNAGASIVTTASRGNRRVIAVVLGGIVPAAKGGPDAKASQRERNQRAAELMFDGLKKLDALKYEPTPNLP